ncbi:ImmA/IrrE family metallo-endopeptidase [Agrobacterium tumefaciens]|nr:ImmA/IrrE family metallo-endopeptidase [Agrobacterium tumefaciens]
MSRCAYRVGSFDPDKRGQMASIYKDPIPTRASKASVAAFAESVAAELSFNAGEPIEDVVSSLGGAISYRNPVGEAIPESIRVEPSCKFKIFLSSLTSVSRDRFTLAHELGHFFLHFPLVSQAFPGFGMRATRWVDESNPDLQRCEWEANWFAASFVMPEAPFREVFPQGIASASSFFGVSEKAVVVRAKSLDLPV